MTLQLRCGHISIEPGAPIDIEIVWPTILKLADYGEGHPQSVEDLESHMLYGLEVRMPSVHCEFYVCRDAIKLHTDLTIMPDMATFGLILAADSDLMLTTGRGDIRAKAGDCYLLDPNKRHGTKTNGFLAFATRDYHLGSLPSASQFRDQVARELLEVSKHHQLGYRLNPQG